MLVNEKVSAKDRMGLMMTIENGLLTIGLGDCTRCWGTGTVYTRKTCPKCKGSGNGPRGGFHTCKQCRGRGDVVNHDVLETCPTCAGKAHEVQQGTLYDSTPSAFWQYFNFKVFRSIRPATFNERLLGLGCLYSITDYGQSSKMNDTELIEHIRADTHSTQALNIARERADLPANTFEVCDYIGVFCSRGGYSLRAVYDDNPEKVAAKIANERISTPTQREASAAWMQAILGK